MYMHQILKKTTALIMTVFMAASSAQPGILASSLGETERGAISGTDETGTGEISTAAETEGSASAPPITQEPAYRSDVYTIALDLRSPNGVVVFNEGKDTEQTVNVYTNESHETISSVVNARGELLKQYLVTEESPYAVIWTQGSGDKVNIKAVANDGYTVSSYRSYVLNEAATEFVLQDIGFLPETYITYDCTVTADTNRVIAVDFAPSRTSDDDIEIGPEIAPATEAAPMEESPEERVEETTPAKEGPEKSVPAQTEAPFESEESLPMTEVPSITENEATPLAETEPAGTSILPTETTLSGEAGKTDTAASVETGETETGISVEAEETETGISVETEETETGISIETEGTETIVSVEAEEPETAASVEPGEPEDSEIRTEETVSSKETTEASETEDRTAEGDSDATLPETEEAVIKEETEEEEIEETETEKPDTFADDTTNYAFDADFSSMRLVVLTSDPAVVIDPEHVIGNYDDIYLLQYKTIQQAMAAYAYYMGAADAVEPDSAVETADEGETGTNEAKTDNPVSNIETTGEIPANSDSRVIALLDTGTEDLPNVIGRVSLIDDQLSGGSHGNEMAGAILGQNPEAQILSVRVMDNNGKGTIASIVSGIEYAIEQNASIINLSVYGRNTIANTVLEKEINKAISLGITVAGAAGNDGSNVSGYVPGRIESAYILGACDETGAKIPQSNYGSTVDYYAVAESTSQAAAMFSGYISAYGVDSIGGNGPVFFAPGSYAEQPSTEEETEPQDETEQDKTEYETEEGTQEAETKARPKNGSEVRLTETFWYRDKYYDFTAYNPYPDDAYVATTYLSGDEVNFETVKPEEQFTMNYRHTATDEDDHSWTSKTTFQATSLLMDASVKSEYADRILPSWIPQSGSILPLPELSETTIEGLRYTVPQGTKDFALDKLSNGYDVKKFRIWPYDPGYFDINTIGTYEVLYKASYFMDPDHEWFVKSVVEVVPAGEHVNVIRNESDSIKVLLNDETDIPFGVPVQLEDYAFRISVEAWNHNMLNEISPRITVMANDNEDITEYAEIDEEQEDGKTIFVITLPEDRSEMSVIVKDEANKLVFDGKNSYSGNWRPIDADNLGYSSLTEEEFSEVEAYYDDNYDPEDEPLEFGDGTFNVAAKQKLSKKTWKNSSSLTLYKYNGMNSADWNDTYKWYHAIRVRITSALAEKVKAYVKDKCPAIYWTDGLQTKFDAKIDKYVNDYLMRLVCTANDAAHINLGLKGWQDADAKYFLKQTGSNAPEFSISGTHKTTTNSAGNELHTWKFKINGVVNPNHAAHNGLNRQTFGYSKSFTIKETLTEYSFSVTKVNSDASLPAHLTAYQNLSATFYVCTDPANPTGTVVPDGIIVAEADGESDDSVDDLAYGTTYYCWEDPNSTVNYTATQNPIPFSQTAEGGDTLEIEFPNAPVKMNISLKKYSTNEGITNGNRMYDLSNIPFTIWSSAQGTVRTPSTNASGEWAENDLWKDTYVVQEAAQGTGFKTSSSPQTVTPADGTTQLTYSLTYPNEPLYATPSVLIRKDPTPSQTENASLAGASFRIDYYDDIPRAMTGAVVTDFINTTAPAKTWQETSEANGDVKINHSPYTDPSHPENNNHIIPLGTVVITELTPPVNGRYYVNTTRVIATFTQNGNSVDARYYQLTDDGSWIPPT